MKNELVEKENELDVDDLVEDFDDVEEKQSDDGKDISEDLNKEEPEWKKLGQPRFIKLKCLVTDKEVGAGQPRLGKLVKKFGSLEDLKEKYVSREGRKILKERKENKG